MRSIYPHSLYPHSFFLTVFSILLISSCVESDHLDYGAKIQGIYLQGDCFLYQGKVNQIAQVMNKNYRYQELETGSELIYPIKAIDKLSKKVDCSRK